ncbi:MAG TPA: nicotinate-nucleotide adenylyltransferase [Devosiaceae bacterium]|jgi:nicotinate-nucleotide adenylyltransferase|nr:nicotinate-nucleotide adenylyltransferase [Devosiaceae bacterium]
MSEPGTDITDLPPATPGMRIGLFGGSFNPAHEGHRLVALQCLRRLRLDKVWLLVSPGNPLKENAALPPLAHRVRATRELMRHPDIEVTGFEALHGFRYTYDTIRYLTESQGAVRFVWIMGADNLVQFDQWERWRDIADCMPIAVYARPGSTRQATASPAALTLRSRRIPEAEAETLADREPPVWVYLHGITSPQSSTAIRARQTGAAD